MAGDGPRLSDEELEREGGVFVRRGGGREVTCAEDECAPDDYVDDEINDDGVPGTVDDLPFDYGVETPDAADESLDNVQRQRGRRRRGPGIG